MITYVIIFSPLKDLSPKCLLVKIGRHLPVVGARELFKNIYNILQHLDLNFKKLL
jgi:hypothetical protein